MTKRREPLTYHRTLTIIASVIGWDRCGAICGVGDRTVRYWSDPDCETEIRLIDAERLDRAFIAAGGDHAPFHRLYALRLEIVERELADACIATMAGRSAKETGEAIQALIEAAANASPDAIRRARKEGEEAIGSLKDSLAALDRIAGDRT